MYLNFIYILTIHVSQNQPDITFSKLRDFLPIITAILPKFDGFSSTDLIEMP